MVDEVWNERGLFWPNAEAVPKGHFAQPSAVPGTLKIDNQGFASVELDGVLGEATNLASIFRRLGEDIPQNAAIQGVLKESGKYVLLAELARDHRTFSMNNVSHEAYSALSCFIGTDPFASGRSVSLRGWSVDLSDLSEWVRTSHISVRRTKRAVAAQYRRVPARTFRMSDGSVTLKRDLSVPFQSPAGSVTLAERVSLRVRHRCAYSLAELKSELGRLDGLFTVLVGGGCDRGWPRVWTWSGKECTLYYARTKSALPPPQTHQSWTDLETVGAEFGALYSAWMEKSAAFGPGFYLYAGSVRRNDLYPEHQFMSLMWGLEAFHRAKYGSLPPTAKLQDKVERIIAAAQPSDRRWLVKKLSHASELPLDGRLKELFILLPIELDPRRVAKFCTACATNRNDISHFGGARTGRTYDALLEEVVLQSALLQRVYRALLLLEIGLGADQIRGWLGGAARGHETRWYLRRNGLID